MTKGIEIILTCMDCSRRSAPFEGAEIDTYTWHDAPDDAVTLDHYPSGWYIYVSMGIVLCPDHSSTERIKQCHEAYYAEARRLRIAH